MIFGVVIVKSDEFISVCPKGKPAFCLEDFRNLSWIELQGILKQCHKNIRKKKQNFWWEPLPFVVVSNQSYHLNSCHQIPLSILLLVAFIKLFFLVNSQMQFQKMILEKYQFLNFFNDTIILLDAPRWSLVDTVLWNHSDPALWIYNAIQHLPSWSRHK